LAPSCLSGENLFAFLQQFNFNEIKNQGGCLMKKDAVHGKKRKLFHCLPFTALLLLATPLFAQFRSFETKYLRLIYYDKNHRYLIPHLARCFENSFGFHRRLFDYTPAEKVIIFLNDFTDFGGAGANTIPWNYLTVGIEPFDYVYETAPANERMNWLMHHELAHVVAMDKPVGLDRVARKIFFGKVEPIAENPASILYTYFTNPRRYAPRWFHEGIAVFLETWMSGGFGRVLNGYDEMVFRTMVRDSTYIYDVVGLESEGTTIDFQVGNLSYLYGTRFVSYLAEKHGPEKILQWFNRARESKKFFAAQFKKVYGVPLDREWSRWIQAEKQWQAANLDSIRIYPTTSSRAITRNALGAVSRAHYDSARQKLYTAVFSPGQLAQAVEIDVHSGRVRKLCEIATPILYYVASVAYDPAAGNLFYTTDNSRAWRDIWCVNASTGQNRLLLKNCRIGDLVINPADKSLWGVQHHDGLSTLVRIPPPYRSWQSLMTLGYGKDIYDLDLSPQGDWLTASFVEISGRQRLIRMEVAKLLQQQNDFEALHEFEANAPANFVFSPDGKYLYGSSYYSGVSNVYRYDFATKEMAILTNGETGFFRPAPFTADSLIAFHYTGKGFLPVAIPAQPLEDVNAIKYLGQKIVEDHPVVKSWLAGSPGRINIDSLKTYDGEYRAFRSTKLASAYPIVEGYKDVASYGLRFNFQDPLGLHAADFTASFAPNRDLPADEKFHFNFKYAHRPWTIRAGYNRADFYDLFGPTKTSLKGYSLGVQYEKPLFSERPRVLDFKVALAGYGGLERLPDYQNVAATFDKLFTGSASLNYKNLRKSLGAVEEEKGAAWSLNFHGNYVNAKFFPQFYANYDYGVLLPLDHSSLWLRSAAGYAFGGRSEPFANFFFGGFGNNWIDHQSAQRYREYYGFPGVELNEIAGTNFGKMLLEWTLPPLRFRRFGFPNLYCRWARPALFTSGIVTNVDSETQSRKLISVGGQIDFQIVLFSMLKSTFSVGYAVAAEDERRAQKEFMVSLKILE
jgi:hypothetical protein